MFFFAVVPSEAGSRAEEVARPRGSLPGTGAGMDPLLPSRHGSGAYDGGRPSQLRPVVCLWPAGPYPMVVLIPGGIASATGNLSDVILRGRSTANNVPFPPSRRSLPVISSLSRNLSHEGHFWERFLDKLEMTLNVQAPFANNPR